MQPFGTDATRRFIGTRANFNSNQLSNYCALPSPILRVSQGDHFRLYEKLGSHCITLEDVKGTWFAVWAPNAVNVSVIGGFNHWDATVDALRLRDDGSGIWEGFIADVAVGAK